MSALPLKPDIERQVGEERRCAARRGHLAWLKPGDPCTSPDLPMITEGLGRHFGVAMILHATTCGERWIACHEHVTRFEVKSENHAVAARVSIASISKSNPRGSI